jgi:hypothetical protein
VKGSIITTKTWFLLIGAALLISAGLLNFRQRARHETPPWMVSNGSIRKMGLSPAVSNAGRPRSGRGCCRATS